MHSQLNLHASSPAKPAKKSVSPRRPSPLKKSASSQKTLRSPVHNRSASPPRDERDPISSKMVSARGALSETIDTYTLLIRSKNPMRCLKHNTSISLYCETEQKLLCANCIFGRLEHKFHRVTPIDRAYDRVEKDIDTMNRLITREIDSMQKANQKLVDSLMQEEGDAHDCLGALVEAYEECHRRLEEGFLSAKARVIEKIDLIRLRYERMMYELKLHMENYAAGAALRPVGKDFFKREEILLYEHAVCSAIAAQRRIEWSEWADGRREISAIGSDEKRKIAAVREAIGKAFGGKK